MARRARSLNELPGHLRVPILRRKDTERTKERLAAGMAGLEELKSLRQQHQQLVGETITKAADRRFERKQGDKGPVDCPRSPVHSPIQTPSTPRQPLPRTKFFGRSMDSILEEEDGTSTTWATARGQRHWDINNNRDGDAECLPSHTTQPKVFTCNESHSSDFSPNTSNSSLSFIQENHVPENNESRSNCERNGHTPIPLPRRNKSGAAFDQSDCQQMCEYRMTSSPAVLSRSHSVSECQHDQTAGSVARRQRTASLDLGHSDIHSFHPLIPMPSQANRNTHKFSSLSSLNMIPDGSIDISGDKNSCFRGSARLSQSTTQLSDLNVCSRPAKQSSLKRRGSLQWDCLLKSIGISNSTSATDLDKSDEIFNEASVETGNNDNVYNATYTDKENNSNFQMNKKKGRSMSFSYGQSTHPIPPQTFTRPRAGEKTTPDDIRFETHAFADKQSLHSNPQSPSSVHPILRRASIQCEAVLTKSTRVVNPIQDVDVNRMKTPGPLHAVMLQYKNYNPPPARPSPEQNVNKLNTPGICSTRKSDECLPCRPNKVEHFIPQPSETPSNIPSRVLDICDTLTPKSTPSRLQDPTCENVTQENAQLAETVVEGVDEKLLERDKGNTTDYANIGNRNSSPHCITEKNIKYCRRSSVHDIVNHSGNVSSVSNGGIELLAGHHTQNSNSQKSCVTQSNDSRASDVMEYSNLRDRESKNVTLCSPTLTPNCRQNGKQSHAINTGIEQVPAVCVNQKKTAESGSKIEFSDRSREDPKAIVCDQNNNPDHEFIQNGSKLSDSRSPSIQDGRKNKNNPALFYTNEYLQNASSELHHQKTLSPPQTCSQLQRHLAMFDNEDEKDRIRAKRASIFSDVSLMSDLSSKTPSSCASVFSDVSMVSDEGYNTSCESAGLDSRSGPLKRFSSLPKPPLITTTPVKYTDNSLVSSLYNAKKERECEGSLDKSEVSTNPTANSDSVASIKHANFGGKQTPSMYSNTRCEQKPKTNANIQAVAPRKTLKQTAV